MSANAQARRWCFTINNPGDDDHCHQYWSGWEGVRYGICQRERGESGTDHYQGYIEFSTPRRLTWLRTRCNARAHWEPARGDQASNIAYCSKEEGRVDGPWHLGVAGPAGGAGQGTRSDLLLVQAAIDRGDSDSAVAESYFASWCRYRESFTAYRQLKVVERDWPMEVIVICGPPGTGKSQLARQLAPDAYWWPGAGEWFDGYHGQRVVVMDEFSGGVPWNFLLRLLDRYSLQVQVKGGFRQMTAHCVIITSNKRPEEWYDREKFGDRLGALTRRITMYMWLESVEQFCIFQNGYEI